LLGISKDCSKNPKVSEYKGRTIAPTCTICLKLAEDSRAKFFKTWVETGKFHEECAKMADAADNGTPLESMSAGGMLRLEPSFCAVSNHFFQNKAARGGKKALWLLAKESYTDRASVLFNNYRTVAWIHDEAFAEVREEVAHECALRQAEIMISAMREECPDVKISTESVLMRRWFKGVKKAVGKDGRLKPSWPKGWDWEPDAVQMRKDMEL
jgi:hypothetical protein